MNKKQAVNLDEAILRATIALGGQTSGTGAFSTREIAERCAISEFVIFSRFKNKDALLARAGELAYAEISKEALSLSAATPVLHDFLNAYLDWLIAHPELTFFSLNYGHGVPHIAPLKDDRLTHRKKVIDDGNVILTHFGVGEPQDHLLLWSYALRHLLYFAGYVIHQQGTDTPTNRRQMEMLITHGLEAIAHEGDAHV